MDNSFGVYRNARNCVKRKIVGRCAQCGGAVYSENDALVIIGLDDIIHEECREEYFEEHLFDFAERISASEEE